MIGRIRPAPPPPRLAPGVEAKAPPALTPAQEREAALDALRQDPQRRDAAAKALVYAVIRLAWAKARAEAAAGTVHVRKHRGKSGVEAAAAGSAAAAAAAAAAGAAAEEAAEEAKAAASAAKAMSAESVAALYCRTAGAARAGFACLAISSHFSNHAHCCHLSPSEACISVTRLSQRASSRTVQPPTPSWCSIPSRQLR